MNEKDFIYSKDIKLNGVVKWSAPSNIAIVKYWGKLENQIPQNPSISLTLSKSITNTSLSLTPKKNKISKCPTIFLKHPLLVAHANFLSTSFEFEKMGRF